MILECFRGNLQDVNALGTVQTVFFVICYFRDKETRPAVQNEM